MSTLVDLQRLFHLRHHTAARSVMFVLDRHRDSEGNFVGDFCPGCYAEQSLSTLNFDSRSDRTGKADAEITGRRAVLGRVLREYGHRCGKENS